MINSEKILKLITSKGKNTTLEEIETLLKEQDREKIKETQKDRFRYEIWDKKADINGISAPRIIDSRPYEINKAYLIYIDEKLSYFQDHKPNENGYVKMTKKEADLEAQNFINQKIEEYVDLIIANRIIDLIIK